MHKQKTKKFLGDSSVYHQIIGIDVGGTKCAVIKVTLSGKNFRKSEI